MKTIKHFSLTLTLILSLLYVGYGNNTIPTIVGNDISHSNFFKIKGEMLNHDYADILVFEYDDDTQLWVQTKSLKHKSKFNLKLNPTKDYQIWFNTDEGNCKQLYVERGEEGPYYFWLYIDYLYPDPYAKLKQSEHEYQLVFLDQIPETPTKSSNLLN